MVIIKGIKKAYKGYTDIKVGITQELTRYEKEKMALDKARAQNKARPSMLKRRAKVGIDNTFNTFGRNPILEPAKKKVKKVAKKSKKAGSKSKKAVKKAAKKVIMINGKAYVRV